MHLAVLAPLLHEALGIGDAGLLELVEHVLLGHLDARMRCEGVEREVLLGHVGCLLLHVVAELRGCDALLLQVLVERRALALQLVEEVLQQRGLGLLDHVLGHVALEALGERGERAALLQAREDGLLLRLDLVLELLAQVVDGVDADLGLNPLVGELGELLLLYTEDLHVEVDRGGLAHERARHGGGLARDVDGELLGVALLQADELFVEGGGKHARPDAVLQLVVGDGRDVFAVVVSGRNLEVHELVFLHLRVGRRGDNLVVMLEQRIDLLVDLLGRRALGRHLDLNRIVVLQLGRGLHADLDGVGVGLLVLHELHVLLAEVGLAHRVQAALVDGERIGLVHERIGDHGHGGVLAEHAVDNRARRLAPAESGEVVVVREFLVLLLHAVGNDLFVDGDGKLGAVALQDLNFSFH